MTRFVQLFRELDSTNSTNERVDALVRYFREVDDADLAWAVYILSGRRTRRLMTSRVLRDSFAELTDLPAWLIEESYAHVGDSAETVALLVEAGTGPARERRFGSQPRTDGEPRTNGEPQADPSRESASGAKLASLAEWLEKRIPGLASENQTRRLELLSHYWSMLDREELFVFHKLLTGGFRVGVSERLVIRALSQAFGTPQPDISLQLAGELRPEPALARAIREPNAAEVEPSRPYPFFLAHQLEADTFAGEDPADWQAEWKWDGIRAQAIKREGEVYLWSRGNDLINAQFPDLCGALRLLPDGTVLDAELVAWSDQDAEARSFAHLQRRLGRKAPGKSIRAEEPVHLVVFDCLERNGRDLRGLPLSERRIALEQVLEEARSARLHRSEVVPFSDFADLDRLRQTARERGVEGLMLKRRESAYGVGRPRGDWWKHKVDPYVLDAVLIYAQAGSGRRANLFTDYTFALWKDDELVPFAKAYSGLSNAEIAELDRWIRRHTVQKYGPARAVSPEQVFEIAFEGVAESGRHKSGVAVRFPRIHRWRRKKKAAEADRVESLWKLIS